jgi:hypothetical protein
MRVLGAAVLSVSMLVSASAAPDADAAVEARAAFEAILVPTDDGPSLTRRVRRFLAVDPATARKVETDAWEASGPSDDVENLVAFLHGVERRDPPGLGDAGPAGYVVVEGAVVQGPVGGDGHDDALKRRRVESFDDFVGKRPLRVLDAPRAAALLAATTREDFMRRPESVREELTKSLGESCAADPASLAELLRRFDAAPDAELAVALGWTERTAALERLVARARKLAPGRGAIGTSAATELDAVLRGIRHASADALDRLLGEFSFAVGDRMAACLDATTLLKRRLRPLDSAVSPGALRQAQARLFDLEPMLETGRWAGTPPAGDLARRLLDALLEAVEAGDADLRREALRTFAAFWMHGEPGAASLPMELRRLVEDVRDGRVTFRRAGLWERTARTDAPPVAVRVTAHCESDGLHVSLRNAGGRTALNAAALRHARAWRTDRGGLRGDGRRLHVALGLREGTAVYSSSCVVLLLPGRTYDFVVPVADGARECESIHVALEPTTVVGEPAAPLLWFPETAAR